MTKRNTDIKAILATHEPSLSSDERAALWTRVREELTPHTPIVSPFAQFVSHAPRTVSVALILLLVLGGTGTSLAAQNALPGDLLFPVKRTIENTTRTIAPTEALRTSIEVEQRNERINELRLILTESTRSEVGTSTQSTTSVHDTKRVQASLDAIHSFLDSTRTDDVERAKILETIRTEINGRALGITFDPHTLRLEHASARTHTELDEREEHAAEVRAGDADTHVRENDDERAREKNESGDSQYEDMTEEDDTGDDTRAFENEEGRDVNHDADDEQKEKDDTTSYHPNNDPLTKIEARAQNGRAEVRAEHARERDEFDLPFVSRADLVSALAKRYETTDTNIESMLDLEVE